MKRGHALKPQDLSFISGEAVDRVKSLGIKRTVL